MEELLLLLFIRLSEELLLLGLHEAIGLRLFGLLERGSGDSPRHFPI